MIASSGAKLAPPLITKITDSKGVVLFEATGDALTEDQRVIPARSAFVTASRCASSHRWTAPLQHHSDWRSEAFTGNTAVRALGMDSAEPGGAPGSAASGPLP